MNLKDLIRELGGPAAVGRIVGVRSQAVSQWMRTGRVPPARVAALLRLCRLKDLPVRPEQLAPGFDWKA